MSYKGDKTMKKIILSIFVLGSIFLGSAKKSEASNYLTACSTAVLVSTQTRMEVMWVQVSTGYSNPAYYVLLIDSNPFSMRNPGSAVGTTLQGEMGNYTNAMYITPPIIPLVATGTINCNQFYNYTDANGNGLPVENGLVILQPAGLPSWVTVGIRRSR
jgi:hypothetical protein